MPQKPVGDRGGVVGCTPDRVDGIGGAMTFYWILWGWDALIALVFVVFFVWGLADGSVSEFNILLWLGILAALGGVLGGSSWLRSAGRLRTAKAVLLALAIPGFLIALFFLVLIIAQPRWN